MLEIILIIIVVWNFIGFLIMLCAGFQYLNPTVIYKNLKVNKIGCTLLTIANSLVCPIATILFWIYVLCTFGRKD